MTPRRDARLVRIVIALLCIGMFVAGLALFALRGRVTDNSAALTAMRRENAQLAHALAVERKAREDQRRRFLRALRHCQRTHGRACTPPPPTPTPSQPTGPAPAHESPSPEPRATPESPQPRPSPTHSPRPSPSPSPTCLVRVSRICVQPGS